MERKKKPNVSYFHTFGCKCFIHNNGKDNLGKFDARSDEGIFLGYSTSNKTYKVYNKRTLVVEESMHVIFDDTNNSTKNIVILNEEDEAINASISSQKQ